MVGLPARGKTHRAVALQRYLRWLGVRAKSFHLADYRREIVAHDAFMPVEYFNRSVRDPKLLDLRKQVLQACLKDLTAYYDDGGQIAVYDASNPRVEDRRHIFNLCKERGIETMFVENLVTKETLLARNIGDVPNTSPDYEHSCHDESIAHFLQLLDVRLNQYQPLHEKELVYIKMMNDGERCVVNNGPLHYLLNRVLMFLLNSRRHHGSFYFARAGTTDVPDESGRDDNPLSSRGREYARSLACTVLEHISSKQSTALSSDIQTLQLARYADKRPSMSNSLLSATQSRPSSSSPTPSAPGTPMRPPLMVWTSTRIKTVQTAEYLCQADIPVVHDSRLNQLNPGVAAHCSPEELESRFPHEYAVHRRDPYHHRYPQGESYQDVAVRLETPIMELERMETDLLVIAHESVLKVFYGYLMGSTTEEIPNLKFPANEIVEIVSRGATKSVNRILIPGTTPDGGVDS